MDIRAKGGSSADRHHRRIFRMTQMGQASCELQQ